MSGVAKHSSIVARVFSRGWDIAENGCWISRGSVGSGGYKYIRFNGQRMGVHRAAHIAWNGPIPAGDVVRHKCDNPPCINPEHLETGSNNDNRQDSVSRGRHQRGDRHWSSILTDKDVMDIREIYAQGVLTHQMLAEAYGVSRTAITKSINGKRGLL